jgi:NAD(P)-dependent dehydrogenase (short-subunit alcohol dehydrogenase family)
VIVSSAAAAYGRLRLGRDAFSRHPHGFPGYAASKLALVHLALALAAELDGSGVTVNAVHPGDAATNIWRGDGPLMKVVGPIMRRRLRGATEAAVPVVRAATDPGLRGVTGRFLGPGGELPPARKYADAAARRAILDLAARAVGA